jgi:hypothetical protein
MSPFRLPRLLVLLVLVLAVDDIRLRVKLADEQKINDAALLVQKSVDAFYVVGTEILSNGKAVMSALDKVIDISDVTLDSKTPDQLKALLYELRVHVVAAQSKFGQKLHKFEDVYSKIKPTKIE